MQRTQPRPTLLVLAFLSTALLVPGQLTAQDENARKPAPAGQSASAQLPKQDKKTAMRIREELTGAKIPLRGETSYIPVIEEKDLRALIQKMSAAKNEVMKRQEALLESRYDLADQPAREVPCLAVSLCKQACGSSCRRGLPGNNSSL